MKRILVMCIVVVLLGGALALSQRVPTPEEKGRAAVIKLFQSLSEPQKKVAALAWTDNARGAIRFPTEGTGTPISQMSAEQKMLVDDLLRATLSDFGLKRCQEMGGTGRVTFFGTPKDGERFACRIDKNNHLTLFHTEFGKEPGGEFGPIVLGAKGAGVATVWIEEDKLAQELAAALTPDDAKKIKGKGILIGELSEKPRLQARKLLEQRLAIFSTVSRKVADDAIGHDGGIDKLRIVLTGDAGKSINDGGNFSWTITSASFSCNWQFAGKNHPHMTLKAKRPG